MSYVTRNLSTTGGSQPWRFHATDLDGNYLPGPGHQGLRRECQECYDAKHGTITSIENGKVKRGTVTPTPDIAGVVFGKALTKQVKTDFEAKHPQFSRLSSYYSALHVIGDVTPPFTTLKVVDRTAKSVFGGSFKFDRPEPQADGTITPGKWHEIPPSQGIELCRRGFHFTDVQNLGSWYNSGYAVYEIEVGGPWAGADEKYVTSKMRLVRELTVEQIKEALNVGKGRQQTMASMPTGREIMDAMPELSGLGWDASLIPTGNHPLLDKMRAAVAAKDVKAYETARAEIEKEREALSLEAKVAALRGKDSAAKKADTTRAMLAVSDRVMLEDAYMNDVSYRVNTYVKKQYADSSPMVQSMVSSLWTAKISTAQFELRLKRQIEMEATPEDQRKGWLVPAPYWR